MPNLEASHSILSIFLQFINIENDQLNRVTHLLRRAINFFVLFCFFTHTSRSVINCWTFSQLLRVCFHTNRSVPPLPSSYHFFVNYQSLVASILLPLFPCHGWVYPAVCVCFLFFLIPSGVGDATQTPWPFCVAVSTAFIRPITTQCSTLIFTLCEWSRMVSGRDCNGEGRTEEKTTKNQTCASGGSKGGVPGECPLPTDQNVLNFMQFFFGKFGKIAWCSLPPSPLRVGAPSYWNAGSAPAVRKQSTWNEDGLKHLSLFAIVHCNDINLFSQ